MSGTAVTRRLGRLSLLVAAMLSAPVGSSATVRREQTLAASARCIGFVGRNTYVAPLGGGSASLCAALVQRCANAAGATAQLHAVPVTVPPPYTVCD